MCGRHDDVVSFEGRFDDVLRKAVGAEPHAEGAEALDLEGGPLVLIEDDGVHGLDVVVPLAGRLRRLALARDVASNLQSIRIR